MSNPACNPMCEMMCGEGCFLSGCGPCILPQDKESIAVTPEQKLGSFLKDNPDSAKILVERTREFL